MSSRGGLGQSRGAALGLQPLKATVPFQLASGKAKAHQSGMRRTVSLDAIVGPYLQGHWPKEMDSPSSLCRKDKSTQVRELANVRGLLTFLNTNSHYIKQFLEVPDGHRAPIPSHSCSSGSQSDQASTPLSSSSTSSSPCCSPTELPLLISSSPGPNKSFCFQREPPEGCEKVRVWEETSTVDQPKCTAIASCPDPKKVNFTPHGGSAFCPVSLLKPLLPSMDLLFRSLSVSPASNLADQSPSSGKNPVGSVIEASGEGLAF
uniref:Family with sequence similarity 117 member Aa n=1 Tax=Periophthalmus magnuspinnatus TaxID=409849 RepID=A0A3B4AL81_9GOBI